MDLDSFKASLEQDEPPGELPGALLALWYAAKGDWHRAHEFAQAENDETGAWVHAYLHRVEGDQANAGYWYRRAGKARCEAPLQKEWEEIAATLLPVS